MDLMSIAHWVRHLQMMNEGYTSWTQAGEAYVRSELSNHIRSLNDKNRKLALTRKKLSAEGRYSIMIYPQETIS